MPAWRRSLLLLLILLLTPACLLDDDSSPEAGALPPCDWARVVRVVDGDTIVANVRGAEERVRYIGIDTPETVAPDQPVEPFGPEASARNAHLLSGGRVCLEKDVSERDRFGRLLRHPWTAGGTLVSEQLLREGLAVVVTFPPDVKHHESRLLPAQQEAQVAGRGLWAE